MASLVHYRIRPARASRWRRFALRRRRTWSGLAWLLAGVALGAALMLGALGRYEYLSARGGVTVRVDRLTGETQYDVGAGFGRY